MKILILRPTPNKLNLKSYNLQEVGLAKALIRKGHNCDVMYYCGKEKDHEEIVFFDNKKELKIIWKHGYGLFKEGIYPSLNKYINNYDIIQVGGHEGITSTYLNRKFQNKTVNYQGPYYYEKNKGDIKKAKVFDKVLLPLSNPNGMIVGTKSCLATEYLKNKGIKNVTTIGVGLDVDNLENTNESIYNNDFVKYLKNNKKDKYLLYIGVLEERRNIKFLLEIMKKISAKNPKTQLIIIGKGNKKYVDECFKYMKELDLDKNIIYKEKLEQKYMKAVYEIADAFLLPTRYEIFGMVLLEAMYYGLPTFTTYNGGSSTLMNEDNGCIINQFDVDLWVNKIEEVLSNFELKKSISENAKKTIKNNYTWDKLADRFIELYSKRLNGLKGEFQ